MNVNVIKYIYISKKTEAKGVSRESGTAKESICESKDLFGDIVGSLHSRQIYLDQAKLFIKKNKTTNMSVYVGAHAIFSTER